MFINLIKYDLKYILKGVLIFSILLFACAILHNITSYDTTVTILDDQSVIAEPNASVFVQVLHSIFYNAIISFTIALVLNANMRTWYRFKSTFYGDQGYLTHTLPLSRKTLWNAKVATAFLVAISAIAVLAITALIISLTPTGRDLIAIFVLMADMPIHLSILFVCCLILQFFFITFSGLCGTVISQRINFNHAHPVIWGLAIYMLGGMLLVGILFACSFLNPTLHAFFFDANFELNQSFITGLLISIIAGYSVLTVAMYFISQKALKKGINLL